MSNQPLALTSHTKADSEPERKLTLFDDVEDDSITAIVSSVPRYTLHLHTLTLSYLMCWQFIILIGESD